jgi:DNA polymerase III subunit beta
MKFTVSQADLSKALTRIVSVVPVKTTLPLLSNILLVVEKGELQMTASDLDVSITTKVKVDSSKNGSLTVPAKPFNELIKNLPNIPLQLESDAQFKLYVRCDKGEYRLSGEPDDDYPALPVVDEKGSLKIDAKQLSRMISKTVFAVSSDPLRIALTGVLMQIASKEFRMIATDGHRLAKISYDLFESTLIDPLDVIVPGKALSEVAKDSKESTTINFGENHIRFDMGDTQIYSRILEETYPDYERVIPVENNKRLNAETSTLLEAFKRVSIFANPITHQIQLSMQKGLLQVTAEDIDGGSTGTEKVPVDYEGEPLQIGYNSNLLLSVLNNVDTKEVTIQFKTSTSAGLISPIQQAEHEQQMLLVMPVRINK